MRAKVRAETERGGEEKKGEGRSGRGEPRLRSPQTSDAKGRSSPRVSLRSSRDCKTYRYIEPTVMDFPQTDLYRGKQGEEEPIRFGSETDVAKSCRISYCLNSD